MTLIIGNRKRLVCRLKLDCIIHSTVKMFYPEKECCFENIQFVLLMLDKWLNNIIMDINQYLRGV
ncbi:MAG: hypothetical protein DHS20C09_02220 [marine bacterium B5-7]|nr:MAG: hypothetical protein DHS20C09_02220 [marine bacterium B5-7]